MEFRTLEGEDPALVFDAFTAAFADYAVPLRWSRPDFEANNARRGYEASISVAAYEGGRIAGFALNGLGSFGGRVAAYDMGTGVLPAARGAGLAGLIAARAVGLLRDRGLGLYVLEVLRGNAPAIKTYERAGFRVTRDFECPGGAFVGPRPAGGGAAPAGTPPAGLRVEELPSFPREEAAAMRDWEPSWQNSDDSVARHPFPLIVLGAGMGGRLAGYVVAQPSGTIWQLVVARGDRRRGIGTALLAALAARTEGGLRYVNVQSDDIATLGLLARCGIVEGPGQHEMVLELRPPAGV